ncbi:MAG: NAD(P)-dependent oxidoreductase, partial [Myxococcota bacterium]|nr:NAD(P)-dependent oxidoreductase [Myxococcota bacterium]
MHVLIADKLPGGSFQNLADQGVELTVDPALKGETLLEALSTTAADALVVRSTRVTAEMLAASSLSLVVRAGAGFNTIDVDAASELGVFVANCPGKNSFAVAELVIGLLLSADRQIPNAVAELRDGRWNKAKYSKARGLAGRCLGVVGGGRIGLAVAERALALGMDVRVWNIPGEGVEERCRQIGASFVEDLHSLLEDVDAVTLHLAENDHTRGIAGREFFERLRPGAIFINTARSGLVDEQALQQALDERQIRAALDVFTGEAAGGTGEVSSELLKHPSVMATPHIGASTDQAQEAVAAEAARIVSSYLRNGVAPNVVNL